MVFDEYKEVVSTAATAVTIIQFLSGADICKTIIRQGSTGEISGFPFVVGSFSTGLWLTYSLILHDTPMTITNVTGLTLQMIYLLVYLLYCVSLGQWRTIKRQMLFFGFLFSSIAYYRVSTGHSFEQLSKNIGLLCCISSIVFCMSPLVSLREVFKTKSTEILPFPLILSMFFVGGLWCLYGVIIDNSFIMYPNFLVFIIAGFELLLFIVYPKKLKEPLLMET